MGARPRSQVADVAGCRPEDDEKQHQTTETARCSQAAEEADAAREGRPGSDCGFSGSESVVSELDPEFWRISFVRGETKATCKEN